MRRPTLTLLVGATLLVSGGFQEASAGRSRRSDDSLGGSAARARSGGEALAQSFYERAVNLGKQGQFGQAKALMQNVVRKNPSNEKYRYYYALLLYKIGDFGEAGSECRLLERGALERYRRKGRALMARIDKINTGEIPLVQPLRSPSYLGGEGVAMRNLRGFPEGAYMNVADMAAMAAQGRAPGVVLRTGSSFDSASYRELREAATGSAGMGGDLENQIATAATETVADNAASSGLGDGFIDPDEFESGGGFAAEVTGDDNPFSKENGWIDPDQVSPPASKPSTPSKPASSSKPAKPAAVASLSDNPFEPAGDNAFADASSAFEDLGSNSGAKDNIWEEETEPTPPPPPTPKPAAKPAPKPAAKPAPKPAAKPAPKPPAPAPAKPADGFSDGAFGDEGFGDFGEETPATPPAATPAPADDAGFGDTDGFDSFEGF